MGKITLNFIREEYAKQRLKASLDSGGFTEADIEKVTITNIGHGYIHHNFRLSGGKRIVIVEKPD